MRRLAHVILAVVVVFVVGVAATLYTRTRAREAEPPVGPAPVKADLNVKEVRIEEEAGKVRWRLNAEQALIYDEKGAVGRRYRRQDEAGTPFCLTVDGQTAQDQTVTVRERDSMSQERVGMDRLESYLATHLVGC